jgi:hypothetical protein
MIQSSVKLEPGNWEITTIGLRCDYTSDFVTIIVNRDWMAKCAWHLKYKLNASKAQTEKIGKTTKQRIDKCVGTDCPIVTEYRDKLIEEELGKA